MVSLEHQIKLLHQCLVDKFKEIKEENENIETRLHKIEELLCKEKQMEAEKSKSQIKGNSTKHPPKERKQSTSTQKPNCKQKKKQVGKSTSSKSKLIKDPDAAENFEVKEDDLDEYGDIGEFDMDRLNEATSEEHHVTQDFEDDGERHDTGRKELPTRCFQGHSFRPLTGWVNKEGNYEISKEAIEFSQSLIQVKIIARDSLEEIAQVSLTIKEIEKAEIVFEDRTVLNIYGHEIFEATQQALLFTNLKSYSLIDEGVSNKIRNNEIFISHQTFVNYTCTQKPYSLSTLRLTFERLNEEDQSLVQEYFKRSAVFFKVISTVTTGEKYFKKLNFQKKSKEQEERCIKISKDSAELIRSIKTFHYMDKKVFSCKICEYLTDKEDKIQSHVQNFHILPKRRMSEQDIVIHYID